MADNDFDLSPWADKDPLNFDEAACMWAGIPPGLLYGDGKKKYPEKCLVALEWQERIRYAVKHGNIRYESENTTISDLVLNHDPMDDLKFRRADLRAFAESIGQRPAFLFPEAVAVAALRCLDCAGKHFSRELEAAILAWQYADELAEGSKRTPKQLIEGWLKENRPMLGVEAFRRVATLANWQKKTGPKQLP